MTKLKNKQKELIYIRRLNCLNKLLTLPGNFLPHNYLKPREINILKKLLI
jgi:hypothetical protein